MPLTHHSFSNVKIVDASKIHKLIAEWLRIAESGNCFINKVNIQAHGITMGQNRQSQGNLE